jgi:tetratricopeptide (TPR) repeat protein
VPNRDAALAGITREFLSAHRLMRRLFALYRSGELRFQDLERLIGDDEHSVLFRLKGRCHALFRRDPERRAVAMRREALFDLAVGSLFHEAMKFRENFYQREVYGPRVRDLRGESGAENAGLFREFEKILSAVAQRLEEGLHESEELLAQTRDQLALLLVEYPDNGFVTRCLIENRADADAVFEKGLDALLALIHGDAATGHLVAGRSYLASGYFAEAEAALERASEQGGCGAEVDRLLAYARGMTAYLAGDYAASVASLSKWLEAAPSQDALLARQAHAVVAKLGVLAQGEDRDRIVTEAGRVLEGIARLSAAAELSDAARA